MTPEESAIVDTLVAMGFPQPNAEQAVTMTVHGAGDRLEQAVTYLVTLLASPTQPEPALHPDAPCKMLLIVRQDLGMGMGKVAAQCCHATLGVYQRVVALPGIHEQQHWLKSWEEDGGPKIVVRCETEEELLGLQYKARCCCGPPRTLGPPCSAAPDVQVKGRAPTCLHPYAMQSASEAQRRGVQNAVILAAFVILFLMSIACVRFVALYQDGVFYHSLARANAVVSHLTHVEPIPGRAAGPLHNLAGLDHIAARTPSASMTAKERRRAQWPGATPMLPLLLSVSVLLGALALAAIQRLLAPLKGTVAPEDLRLIACLATQLAQGRRCFPHPVECAAASGLVALAHRLPSRALNSDPIVLAAVSGEPVGAVRAEPTVLDLMSFGGVLPETINGRCAQLGFIAGVAAELGTGLTMPEQLREYPLAPAVAIAVVTLASVVPRLRGVGSVDPRAQSQAGALFSARNELVNGRTAMVGLMAAMVQEWLTAHTLLG